MVEMDSQSLLLACSSRSVSIFKLMSFFWVCFCSISHRLWEMASFFSFRSTIFCPRSGTNNRHINVSAGGQGELTRNQKLMVFIHTWWMNDVWNIVYIKDYLQPIHVWNILYIEWATPTLFVRLNGFKQRVVVLTFVGAGVCKHTHTMESFIHWLDQVSVNTHTLD